MNNKKVTVAGGGVLGSQIAFQSAFSGFDTTIWLRSEGSIGRSQPKIDRLYKIYPSEIETLRQNLGKPGIQVPGWHRALPHFIRNTVRKMYATM